MGTTYPQHLTRLLEASGPSEEQQAWESLVRQHSRLLLGACRDSGRGYDQMMDRYAYVLEQLRADDYRRLRVFSSDGRTKFSTWLVVVARRLCVDYHRTRYGRSRSGSDTEPQVIDSLLMRRRLADLIGVDVDDTKLPDRSAPDPESALAASEIGDALGRAVGKLSDQDRLLLAMAIERGPQCCPLLRNARQTQGLKAPVQRFRPDHPDRRCSLGAHTHRPSPSVPM